MPVTYICENGHERETHKSRPASSDIDKRAICIECSGRIVERRVPFRECDDCGLSWPYTGESDLPTCPNCKGKRTNPVE